MTKPATEMKSFGNSEPIAPDTGPEAVEFRAAQWSDALREEGGDPELHRAFERWYMADPAHAEAFERIDGAYRTALAAGGSRQMLELENEVLAEDAKRDRHRMRRYALGSAAAAGVVAAVITGYAATVGSWEELQYLRDRALHALAGETLYRTAVGERLAVVLDDGSELTLNTGSRVVVDYDDAVRNVTLARGQALFEVAENPDRPFVVAAGGRTVTALGTAFDVRLSEKELEVTLIEGRVKVEEAPSPQPSPPRGEGAKLSENAPLSSEEGKSSVSPLPPGGEGEHSEGSAANGEGGSSRTTNNDHFDRTRKDGKAGTAAARRGPHMDVRHQQRTTILEPGQRLIVATADPAGIAAAKSEIRRVDVRRAVSWRHGQVIFEEDRLAEAVEEINRYGGRRVVLAGEGISNLRVSGIFRTGDTTVFVETLTRYFPLYVAEADENRIVLAERDSG